jgi:hypothetical protein
MAIKLIVTSPFASYGKGAEITDAKEVQTILDGENQGSVVKVEAPDPKFNPDA